MCGSFLIDSRVIVFALFASKGMSSLKATLNMLEQTSKKRQHVVLARCLSLPELERTITRVPAEVLQKDATREQLVDQERTRLQ